MLTDRLAAFQFHGNTDPFAQAMRKAMTGKDDTSLKLTGEALNILKEHAKKVFGPDDNNRHRRLVQERHGSSQGQELRHPRSATPDQIPGGDTGRADDF
ncbi:hypothetical protein [Nonomuraea sp. NPDC003804]|uniref:hypothetical protein n=1 Tax=Nonomuraea sp. NPDC003804 TaxID=3154547 RepID=UPI0033ABB23A